MRRRVGSGLLVLGLAWGSLATAAEPWRLARFIEADNLFAYVEISRPETVLDRLEGDRVLSLLKAVPRLEKALDSPQASQFREVVRFVAAALDTTPEKAVRDLLGGGIAAVAEGGDKLERIYLTITAKDPAFLEKAHAQLVALARQDAANKGKPDPVKQGEYQGVASYSVAPDEAHAVLEGTLIIANGSEALKALVDRVREPGRVRRPLADDPSWQARQAALPGEAAAWAYARLDRFRQADPKQFAPERIDPGILFLLGPWAEAARHGDWVSLVLTWTDTRLSADLSLSRPAQGFSEAMAGYLPQAGQGAAAPLRVPGLIASGTLWRDFAAIWEARGAIFPPEQQQAFAQLDTFAGQFFGGRDFGSGVLGALGQQYRVVVARQDPATLHPVPDVILPAFAVVLDLQEDDPDFALRLQAAFQSFVGLANLGAAQTKAPPLMLGSEEFEGTTISTAKFLPPPGPPKDEPVHQRHNFSPSAARVGNHFVIGSSLGLTRALVQALRRPPAPGAATLVLAADGAELGRLIDQNRERLVLQNILEEGNDRAEAEAAVALLQKLAEYFGRGSLTATETPDGPRFTLAFDLGQ